MNSKNKASILYLKITAWCTAILLIIAYSVAPVYKSISRTYNKTLEESLVHDDFSFISNSGKSYINVLLAGLDYEQTRTDVLMIAQFSLIDGTIKLLSIPRDTYIEKKGDKKINSSYGVGGIDRTIEDIQKVVDIEIDKYAIITISGFRKVIDKVGGVDYHVPQNMNYEDRYQDLYIHLKEGYQHLDGNKAEQLVRFRSYPRGDIQRIEVQQDFIKEASKQIQEKCVSGEADATVVINDVMSMVETNFTTLESINFVPFLLKADTENIINFTLEGSTPTIKGISYFVADNEKNQKIIDDYFSPESQEIDYSEIALKNDFVGNDKEFFKVEGLDLGDGTIPKGTTVSILDYTKTDGEMLKKAQSLFEKNGCVIIGADYAKTVSSDKTYCITKKHNDLICPVFAKLLGVDNYYINPECPAKADIIIILGKDVHLK